ncbi:hypothetical protein ACPYO6_13845 [Georgenia sp. Z1344]|uniref:hypothetical protein n=1 Tax=Georgenia sp. Z1344 TaxID=3416706 RepID=UPI003CF7CADB
MTSDDLVRQAQAFATDISDTVRSLAPDAAPFTAVALENRVTVEQAPATGIPLNVDGGRLLTLKVKFHCELDSSATFLAVEHSSFAVYAGERASGEPLFR